MFRLILKLEVLLVVCVLMVSLECLCDDDDPTGPASIRHSFVPDRLSLDTAWAGGIDAQGVIQIVNEADDDIFLDFLTTDCPADISWSPTSGTITSSLSITFRFEPNQAYDPSACRFHTSVDGVISAYGEPQLDVTYAAGEARCSLDPGSAIGFPETQVTRTRDATLTLTNTTLDAVSANQFRYEFRDPSGDCGLFPMDPADAAGTLGPGGTREIVVGFAPDRAGSFECRRTLLSLRPLGEDGSLSATHACPSEVVWTGTGVIPSSPWSACLEDDVNDWHGIFGFSSEEIYAAGSGGRVLSSGGDCSWNDIGTEFTTLNLKDIWGSGPETDRVIWAVGSRLPDPGGAGSALRRMESSWTSVDDDALLSYGAVWGSGGDNVYVAGLGVATDFPNAKHWSAGALNTLTISESGMSEVSGVSGTADDDVWAVLKEPFHSVYRFQGGGWENQTPAFATQPLHDVWAVQGTDFYAVYAVGEGGAIYHYDAATGWSDESIPGESRDFYGVWVSGTGQIFVVGEGQAIYQGSVTDPTGWTQQTPASGVPLGDLLDVWGAADNDVYAVGTNGVILRYAPGG